MKGYSHSLNLFPYSLNNWCQHLWWIWIFLCLFNGIVLIRLNYLCPIHDFLNRKIPSLIAAISVLFKSVHAIWNMAINTSFSFLIMLPILDGPGLSCKLPSVFNRHWQFVTSPLVMEIPVLITALNFSIKVRKWIALQFILLVVHIETNMLLFFHFSITTLKELLWL